VVGAKYLVVAAAALTAVTGANAAPSRNRDATQCEAASIYADPVGDSGDAPDLTAITVTPCGDSLRFDITLARPTELGSYGWILVGIDTDRNRATGGAAFGADYLVVANGFGTVIGRWKRRRFDFSFAHSDLNPKLTPTDLSFTLDSSEFRHRQRTFDFAVASLRENADLAPDAGVFSYPIHAAPVAAKSRFLAHLSSSRFPFLVVRSRRSR
jgi:hypothetical protein